MNSVFNKFKLFYSIASDKDTILSALKVSILVGIILNFINQWDLLVSFEIASINFIKFFLTFLVPFIVAIYAATYTKMNIEAGCNSDISAHIKCINCNSTNINIHKGSIIPQCTVCKANTN